MRKDSSGKRREGDSPEKRREKILQKKREDSPRSGSFAENKKGGGGTESLSSTEKIAKRAGAGIVSEAPALSISFVFLLLLFPFALRGPMPPFTLP